MAGGAGAGDATVPDEDDEDAALNAAVGAYSAGAAERGFEDARFGGGATIGVGLRFLEPLDIRGVYRYSSPLDFDQQLGHRDYIVSVAGW